MSESAVLSGIADGIMTITLNRPTVLNAMNADLLAQLGAAFAAAKHDDAVRAVLLTGAGRGFCAGADLSTNSMRTGSDVQEMMRSRYHPIILMMRQFPKPIVGAINGTAAGGGMSLALACDIVLAGESASFLQAFTKIGLVPDCGSTWFLPRMVGDVRATGTQIEGASTVIYKSVATVTFDGTGGAITEHGLFNIIGQHRAVTAKIFPNRLDLLGNPHQELQISVQV
jgi:2-(1,2-epoxy-1,2-dihydrophenyl)acetyl-CoA isomerase